MSSSFATMDHHNATMDQHSIPMEHHTTPESSSSVGEKEHVTHLETVDYSERADSKHDEGLERGLRIDGDGQDHFHEPPMTFKRMMSLIAMAFLWTGSQIPVYLFGAIPPYIYAELGGADRWVWLVLANLLSLAAVCPFVGSLSDVIGRKYIALIGAALIVIGQIICSTSHTMNIFIAGMAISGAGAGINELTALAVTSELAPTSKRGLYVGVLVLSIVPFCPSVIYAQLIAAHSSWRWVGCFCAIWSAIGFIMTAAFYFPPPRVNSQGLSRTEVLKQIDYVGGLLSISGMLLFMMGMQWGGYQYPWSSAHVLVPLILGVVLLVAFCVQQKYAKHPMFPKRLRKGNVRVLFLTLVITFVSGANFFSILMFWPTQAFNVYGHDPIGVGLRGLPVGFAILAGACINLVLLSVLKGHIRMLMIISSVLMTAGCGSLAVAEVNNMYQLWGLLILAGIGIGGIVVPASIITTIICPDDLIATVTALTLSIRVIGGSIGYCVYYNVFLARFIPAATKDIGYVMVYKMGILRADYIKEAIELTGAALLPLIKEIPGVAKHPGGYEMIVAAGQMAFAEAYKQVYYTSIAFGGVSIIAACFLGDITRFYDDHVAVII